MWTNVLRPIGGLTSGSMTAPPYTIRRSNRALHARIQVDADGVEVVVPRHFPLRNVEPFVQEKRPWIERTLRRMRESEAEFAPARLRDGAEIPYLGERLALTVRRGPRRTRAHVSRRGYELRVRLGPRNDLGEALEAWYRRQARLEVAPRLAPGGGGARRGYTQLASRS